MGFLNQILVVVIVVSTKVKDFMTKVLHKIWAKDLTKVEFPTLRLKVVLLVEIFSLSIPSVEKNVEVNVWLVQMLALDKVKWGTKSLNALIFQTRKEQVIAKVKILQVD